MHQVDIVLTLDDREGRPSYNRIIIPKLIKFVNHPANIIVSLHRPKPETLDLFKKYESESVIQKLYVWNDDIGGHSPSHINRVYVNAFSLIEREWVVHFDGDMFFYRRGYDNWLGHMIGLIESGYHNIGAVCHTMPYNHWNPLLQRYEPRRLIIHWVSTRFFVTRASVVKSSLNHSRLFLDWPETYSYEGVMYQVALRPRGLIVVGIPFNPNFLILHIDGMSYWKDGVWEQYENELIGANQILLKNISHSNFGDIQGGGMDCIQEEFCGHGTWKTSGNEGEIIEVLPHD